jgi:hypothetical protein
VTHGSFPFAPASLERVVRCPTMRVNMHPLMMRLAETRPIFHSEADFQHALAWLIHSEHPDATIRLETRPERKLRLDVLVVLDGERMAIELKYFTARTDAIVGGEHFDLPNQAAQDISRHDFVKDIWRLERFVRDGVADVGWAIALSNDGSYWRLGWKADPVDAMFRLHEGRRLQGVLAWSQLAGAGTTRTRDVPLDLTGAYECRWQPFAQIERPVGKPVELRYLALCVGDEPPG